MRFTGYAVKAYVWSIGGGGMSACCNPDPVARQAINGHIMRCRIIGFCRSAATFATVKCFWKPDSCKQHYSKYPDL